MMHLFDWQLQKQGLISVADLGEGPGGGGGGGGGPGPPPPPLFWVKNKRESQKEEKPKGKGTKTAYSPSAKGLDSPLHMYFFAIPTIMWPINKDI